MKTPHALTTSLTLSIVLAFTTAAGAVGQPRQPAMESISPPSSARQAPKGPNGRPFVTVLGGIPIVTYVAANGPRPAQYLSVSDRLSLTQMIGVGYVVNPQVRFGVIGIFSHALTNRPNGAPAWQLGGVAPVGVRTFPRFFVGGGPVFAYRSGGRYQSDVGAVVLSGATFHLENRFAVNLAMPVSGVFRHRRTASLTVAAGLTKVF